MPCFLFTFHAYGSWLPDHPRGYVRRGEGILPTDVRMGLRYAEQMKFREASFGDAVQRIIIAALRESAAAQEGRCHYMATETTHVHLLTSWRSSRSWELMRKQLRYAVSKRLRTDVKRRDWLSKGGSRRQVRDERHFRYLMEIYLSRHSGWKWSERDGEHR